MFPEHQDDNNEPILIATSETLESFHDDVQYLWSSSDIPLYENPPSALNFLRNHVALSRPCIIRNSITVTRPETHESNSDASRNIGSDATAAGTVPLTMTMDDLVRLFPETDENPNVDSSPLEKGQISLPTLCVDVTSDGHGDCLRRVAIDGGVLGREEKVFVKPLETIMSLSEFRRRLRKGRMKQHQQLQQQDCDENYAADILDKVFDSSLSVLRTNMNETDNSKTYDDDFFEDCVLYYSRQNDCLREELSPLWNMKRLESDDGVGGNDSFLFPRSFPWAEEAFFGQQPPSASGNSSASSVGPDAVNLWMGDERAVSAMHKDHYENLFYVLSGEKVFCLCPPSDAPFLYEREVLSGRFRVSRGDCDENDDHHDDSSTLRGENCNEASRRKWSVVLDQEENANSPSSHGDGYSRVHWIATDLFGTNSRRSKDEEEYPLSKYAHPITVRVQAGELLYLPSLWFHRVTQTRETIGINYWYDMNFGSPMWCYFHLLQQLQPKEKWHSRPLNETD